MLTVPTINGIPVQVPETDAEDPSPKFAPDDLDAAVAYYREEGYVILKGLIVPEKCDTAMRLWDTEVRPFPGHMYRQATARAERHRRNSWGWVMNPILNLQSVSPVHFPGFRRFATEEFLTDPALTEVLAKALGDRPKIVQTMYFEGTSPTWEHQDSYYLDSATLGNMIGAWVALEDIAPTAGRFYICPKSHRIDLGLQDADTNIADSHAVYIQRVVDLITSRKIEIRAPKLDKGDVVLWNAWTIHGSLTGEADKHSRSSITCHAIPNRDLFLQLQTRTFDLPTEAVNGAFLFRPKDQAVLKNRLILWVESTFPGPFYWLKRTAIKHLVGRKGG